MRSKVVTFVETECQLDTLQRQEFPSDWQLEYVVVTPEVDYEAERLGIDYRSVEEFYSEAELIDHGILNFETVRQFCDYYDRNIRSAFASFPTAARLTTLSDFYYFKRMFDALLSRVTMVKGTFEVLRPTAVLCFQLPGLPEQHWKSRVATGLTSRVAPYVARTLGVDASFLPSSEPHGTNLSVTDAPNGPTANPIPTSAIRFTTFVSKALKRFGLTASLLRRLMRLRSPGVGKPALTNETGLPLLVFNPNPTVDPIIHCWLNNGNGSVVNVNQVTMHVELSQDHRAAGGRLWNLIRSDATIRELLIIDGVDVWDFVAPALEAHARQEVPFAVAYMEKAPLAFRALRPAVFLSNCMPWLQAYAAREGGVPSAGLQHGGFYGTADYPILEYLELLGPDVFLCAGPGTASYLQRPAAVAATRVGDHRSRSEAVGLATLDALVSVHRRAGRRPETKRRVMYVPTNYYGDLRYFSYHSWPDIWYWRFQRKVILACTSFPDVRLMLKSVPNDLLHSPVEQWLRNNPVSNCEIIDIPFKEALDLSDAFIIDCPTTALLEALTTDRPVIVMAHAAYLRYDAQAAELLRKRAILAATPDQFIAEIKAFLRRSDWSLPKPVNDEFLMEYGTYLNDGKSAERAVQLLSELALRGVA